MWPKKNSSPDAHNLLFIFMYANVCITFYLCQSKSIGPGAIWNRRIGTRTKMNIYLERVRDTFGSTGFNYQRGDYTENCPTPWHCVGRKIWRNQQIQFQFDMIWLIDSSVLIEIGFVKEFPSWKTDSKKNW